MNESEFSSAHVVPVLSQHFYLKPEVWVTHWEDVNRRIDFVGYPKAHTGIPQRNKDGSYAVYGFEVKYDQDLAASLAQSIDYQMSRINDVSYPKMLGIRPRFVFLVHQWYWDGTAPEYIDDPEARNHPLFQAERLAGQLNVGIAYVCRRKGLTLRICGARLWCAAYGPRADIATFNTTKKIGSR